MKLAKKMPSTKQELFREMVLGTLLYSVVLGFFNDYTDVLQIKSYSFTFGVALLMQILTLLTFATKNKVAKWFKQKEGTKYKVGLVVGVWFVLFVSKFVFLAAIDFIFGNSVEISGFIGLLIIIVCLTITQRLVEYIYQKLAD